MLFAHVLVDDPAAFKHLLAMTDSYLYFEAERSTSAGTQRSYERASLATGKVQALAPAKGTTWDLSQTRESRAIGGDHVVISFDDGTIWGASDDSTSVLKLADAQAQDEALEHGATRDGKLYFAANAKGREAFVTDGTPGGTRAFPALRGDGHQGFPRAFVALGDDVFFIASTDETTGGHLLRYDGKKVRPVAGVAGRAVDQLAVVKDRLVTTIDGKLNVLASDRSTAGVVASSRATFVQQLTTVGNGVAFLSDGGVFRSDLTTRGTVRLGDAPVTFTDNALSDLRIDPAGFLVNSYNGSSLGGVVITSPIGTLPGVRTPTPTAVYRLGATTLTKALDGSFRKRQRVGDADYFFSTTLSGPGTVVRVAADDTQTTLTFADYASRSVSNGKVAAFADGADGPLYVIDPSDATGVIGGTVLRDDDFNGKVDDADVAITGGVAFVDYDGDGKLDEGEPHADLGSYGASAGRFLITGVRAGKFDVVVPVGGDFRGGLVRQRVKVRPREITRPTLLATPLPATIRAEVFNDADGDGTRDKNEGGTGGFVVYVDLDNDGTPDAGEPTATTGADGAAIFSGLTPSLYRVRARRPGDTDAFTTSSYAKVHTSGGATSVARFGAIRDPATGAVTGQLRSPVMSRGFGEAAVGLYDAGGDLVARTTANNLGRFAFKNLKRGTYTPAVLGNAQFETSTGAPVDVAFGGSAKVTLDVTVSQRVRGIVYDDLNGNGRRDGDEPLVVGANVIVKRPDLRDAQPQVATIAGGAFDFFVRYGVSRNDNFTVHANSPSGARLSGTTEVFYYDHPEAWTDGVYVELALELK